MTDPTTPTPPPDASAWFDQANRLAGDRFVCGDCGYLWPTSTLGSPFEFDRCRQCGGQMTAVWDVTPPVVPQAPEATTAQPDLRALAAEAAEKWALLYPIPAWGLATGAEAGKLAATWGEQVADAVLAAVLPAATDLGHGYHEVTVRRGVWTWIDAAGVRVMVDHVTEDGVTRHLVRVQRLEADRLHQAAVLLRDRLRALAVEALEATWSQVEPATTDPVAAQEAPPVVPEAPEAQRAAEGDGWRVTAWHCGCHPSVSWSRHDPVAPLVGRDPAGRYLTGTGTAPAAYATLDDLRAAHPGLTPAAVDNVAALLADLDRVTAERDEALDQSRRIRAELVHWRTVIAAEVTADRDRLAAALRVCEYVLNRYTEPTDAETHAGQLAAGAWATDWTPERVLEDLPDWQYQDAGRTGEALKTMNRMQCAVPGCTSAILWESRAAEIDDAARRFLALNGWRTDHEMMWICGHHDPGTDRPGATEAVQETHGDTR